MLLSRRSSLSGPPPPPPPRTYDEPHFLMSNIMENDGGVPSSPPPHMPSSNNHHEFGSPPPLEISDAGGSTPQGSAPSPPAQPPAAPPPVSSSANAASSSAGGTGGGGGGGGKKTVDEAAIAAALSALTPNVLLQQQGLQQAQQQLLDETFNNTMSLEWINKPWVQKIVRTCAMASFISICANTPENLKNSSTINYVTYAVDMVATIVFSVEAIAKIKTRGFFRGDKAYLFDRWCQFDGLMLVFHFLSVLLQSLELADKKPIVSYWSIVRCPRPLILIRVIRAFLRFRLPKNRINIILQRSSSQIYNVTIFFLFFMVLYGILGVQFFGKLQSHCVRNDTLPNSTVYINNLMIPDTYCSPLGPQYGYQCPAGMKCMEVNTNRGDRGYNGFEDVVTSIFTVYEAASQEGWVFLMYRATDSLPSWRAFFYFITMIFFLAWLVKNVFIAVIIETFAEIRVQFQQMWGVRAQEQSLEHTQVFERTEDGLRLVRIDENKPQGIAPAIFQRINSSPFFNMSMLLLVLGNAIITASIKHTHINFIDERTLTIYYYIELVFTIVFDLECLFKISCLGFKNYIKRPIYKFEFILAVGTTLRLVPMLYRTELTYFQVLRLVRLIKSSPLLEDFVNKIFGPGKKLGTLIIFTMCLLIITSSVSMQLFCFLTNNKYRRFATFDMALMSQFAIITNEGWTDTMYDTMYEAEKNYPYFTYFMPVYFIFSHMFSSLAFMTMFQILTQKGWLDIMHSTMRASQSFSPLVAIYFISYHLFVTLIVLSLFVAVILDNLEMEEDVKKLKQAKMREQSAETQRSLPWRLRIFEKFPNHPQMVTLKRVPSEFEVPKIRESFMRQFLGDDYNVFDESQQLPPTAESTTTSSTQQQQAQLASTEDEKDKKEQRAGSKDEAKLEKNMLKMSIKGGGKKSNLPSIIESAKADGADESTFRRRKFNAPNAHAAQLRILNNIRMQRACRYSQKKLAINTIVNNSNNQRLFIGEVPVGFATTTTTAGGTGGGDQQALLLPAGGQAGVGNMPMPQQQQHQQQQSTGGKLKNLMTPGGKQQQQARNPLLVPGGFAGASGGGGADFKMFQFKKQQAELKRNQLEEDLKENHPYFDKPLFTIGRESNLRKFCQMIVQAKYHRKRSQKDQGTSSVVLKDQYKQVHKFLGLVTYLDWIMILVTIQSCVSMMFETPKVRLVDHFELKIAEIIFVVCMSIEMTLKVCAYGLFFTPNAVVKDFGGILDLFIYSVSVLFLIVYPKEVSANSGAQILMLLRCLRPLRIFTLVPHMRKVIYELCRGFKEILLVSILLVVLIFTFANYGLQMFGGRLANCNDQSVSERRYCVGVYRRNMSVTKLKLDADPTKTVPSIWAPRVWANPYNFNFDAIGSSMLALFEVLSLEGWLEVRDIIISRMGTRHAVFVHVFVFIGTLIGLTLFVGVVITNYSENKGTALLTVDQRRWLDLKGRIKLAQPLHIPPRPENKLRAFIFDITQHKSFKRLSALVVLLNCCLLSVPWNVKEATTKPLATLAAIFTFLFLLEALMKSCALGPFGYWQSRRNRFDTFVTILGIIWIVFHFVSFRKKEFEETSNTFGFAVIVLRFFTIAGKHATLKMLMLTIIVSFFKSFFIIVGMFLLMLVYAFAGVILFGGVKSGHDLGRHANFRTAPNAIILLMRIVTGEEWNKIMHDCMIAPPACTRSQNFWESDCGNYTAAILYFCSFYVIITYIVLNLLVAIIMENFSLFYSNEEDALLSYNDIRHFQIVWNIVDTNRKGLIPCRRVKFLLRLLRGRLEVDLEKDRLLFKHMCYEIEKLNNGGDVTFHDVLNMLSYRSVDIRKSLKLEELLAREELEYQIEEEVAKQTIRNWLDRCLRRIREKGQSIVGGGDKDKKEEGGGGGGGKKEEKLDKKSELAIFKEQLGARQLQTGKDKQQLGAAGGGAAAEATADQYLPTSFHSFFQKQRQQQQQQAQDEKQQHKQQERAETLDESVGATEPTTTAISRTRTLSEKKLSTSSGGGDEPGSKELIGGIPLKSATSASSKAKRRAHQQAQMQSEEKQNRRKLLILESQSMANDVKNWWKSTLNDIDLEI